MAVPIPVEILLSIVLITSNKATFGLTPAIKTLPEFGFVIWVCKKLCKFLNSLVICATSELMIPTTK